LTDWKDCPVCLEKMAAGYNRLDIDLYHYCFHDPVGNENRKQGIREGCARIKAATKGHKLD